MPVNSINFTFFCMYHRNTCVMDVIQGYDAIEVPTTHPSPAFQNYMDKTLTDLICTY